MRCLQGQLQKAAKECNTAEVCALLERPDKAVFINAGDTVRCSRQHNNTNTPARPAIILQYEVGTTNLRGIRDVTHVAAECSFFVSRCTE